MGMTLATAFFGDNCTDDQDAAALLVAQAMVDLSNIARWSGYSVPETVPEKNIRFVEGQMAYNQLKDIGERAMEARARDDADAMAREVEEVRRQKKG